jgi:hypothetical protein
MSNKDKRSGIDQLVDAEEITAEEAEVMREVSAMLNVAITAAALLNLGARSEDLARIHVATSSGKQNVKPLQPPKTVRGRLSSRAKGVLSALIWPPGSAELLAAWTASDSELLRRASNIKPPLSYARLILQPRCGRATAITICNALGLPVPHVHSNVQCPRCGHVFGGSKL